MSNIPTKTTEQAKAELRARGLTITQWARDNNYTPRDVSLVLNGQYKGNYGKAYDIAVKLGLKAAPDHHTAA